ncbi:hypothetical protein H6G41_12785 [Tolypothrix sp. FACHB-123]|uniref:hypothetical protein n=1 Tax=Tolypothrix sp. FACHB-123 TaxID=2692868 RepID=UPI001683C711|nr:hypothetical protein [Tolypothrix sp. FACHB-123]MBD2355477.1 hypothetical protein [Tolypothrix sp. FACHB-123]
MRSQKRNSSALTKAERRIEGLQMINPNLDFGNGFSITDYHQMVQDVRDKLASYNQSRKMVNQTQNALLQAERALNTYTERMLLKVASQYGKDSDEYSMAGGTRKSERRKPRSTAKQKVMSAELVIE